MRPQSAILEGLGTNINLSADNTKANFKHILQPMHVGSEKISTMDLVE